MKTKFNNSELTHVWANQTQSHGKGSNMFFEGSRIYSYGYHFILADKVEYNGKAAFLINDASYSNTTNKHQGLVYRAIPSNVPFFRVKIFPSDLSSTFQHEHNLKYFIKNATVAKDKAYKATKLKQGYINQSLNHLSIYQKYVEFFNINMSQCIDSTILPTFLSMYDELINYTKSDEFKKWLNRQEENKKKAEAKALIDAKEKIEAFRQFKISSIYANLGHYLLRYNKETDNIETSGGVKMSKDLFLSAYQRLINNELLRGQHVDKYTFNGVDGDIVSVGCHKIPMTEIKNIVAVL
jgi:hypothetical protein